MSTSKHTFDQVKSILGKLDRYIEDARARRLDGDRSAASAAPMAAAASSPAAGAATPQQAAPFPAARPLRATPNYSNGSQGGAFNGRADHKAP